MGKNDFFGDGRSDIILQNTDGSVVLWEMSGTAIVNAGLVGNPGASWSVEATASGTAITPGSGSFTNSSGNVFTVSTAGLAEENGSPLPLGSGTAKWYTTTALCMARMSQPATGISWTATATGPDRSDLVSSATVIPPSHAERRRLGRAVGHERRQIVNAGQWVIPARHGTSRAQAIFSAMVTPNHHAERRRLGRAVGHERPQIINAGLVGDPGPTWHVKGTGDFFGDGNSDLVMQNTDGSVVLWDMSGTTLWTPV